MKGYILSSNVILKWLLQSDSNLELDNFFKQNKNILFSQQLLDYEIRNALIQVVDSVEVIDESLLLLDLLRVKGLETDSTVLKYATEMSIETQTSVYETSYHALALVHDMMFITFDQSYYQNAKVFGYIELADELISKQKIYGKEESK